MTTSNEYELEKNWRNFLRFRGRVDDSNLGVFLLFLLSFNFRHPELFSVLLNKLQESDLDDYTRHLIYDVIEKYFQEEKIDTEILQIIKEIVSNHLLDLILFIRDWEPLYLTEKTFEEAFDFFFEKINKQAGKFGAFSTSQILRDLVQELIPAGALSAMDPACGSGSILSDFLSKGGRQVYGQDIDPKALIFARLRFLGNSSVELSQGNSLTSELFEGQKVDVLLSNPPYNLKVGRDEIWQMNSGFGEGMITSRIANLAWIKLGLFHLKEHGTGIVILPMSSLFNSTENGLRQYLIESGQVQAIIGLPGNLLLYSGVSVCIWVFNKNSAAVKRDVLFIDASNYKVGTNDSQLVAQIGTVVESHREGGFLKDSDFFDFIVVSQEKIREEEYSLQPSRFLFERSKDGEDYEGYSELGSVLYRPKFDSSEALTVEVKKISVQNLNGSLSKVAVNYEELNEGGKRATFIYSDLPIILLARIGKRLKPTILANYQAHALDFVNVFFYEVDTSKVLLEYLIVELEKPYVISQIDRLQTGTTIPSLRRRDLESLKILIPSLEEQKRLVDEEKQRLVQIAELELKSLTEKIGLERADANSFLRHKIAGPLRNLRGAFRNINLMLEEHVISKYPDLLGKKLNEKRTKTFKDYLEIFERDLEKVSKLINQSSDEYAIENKPMEEVDLLSFLDKYLKDIEGTEKGVVFRDFVDNDILEEGGILDIVILSNQELLRDLFDNLVRNAVMHGFKGFDGKKEIHFSVIPNLVESLFQVYLNISNTGNPVRKSFDIELFSKMGAKAGDSEGDGFGLWYVKEIMKKHGGELRFVDESRILGEDQKDLVSTFQLIFPIKDLKKNNGEI